MSKGVFKLSILPLILSAVIVVVDQLAKYFAAMCMTTSQGKFFIKGVLEYAYLENKGIAFGMSQGGRWYFVTFTTLVILALVCAMFNKKINQNRFLVWMFALIVGGGVGNLIDRVRLGYVIDFMRFPISWFNYSFNVADAAVVCGGVALMVYFVVDIIKSSDKHSKKADEPDEK